MTGGERPDRAAEPLSGLDETAPDDLFAGRSRRPKRSEQSERSGHKARAEAPHDGEDDLYGASAAVAPTTEGDEGSAADEDSGADW